jgi:hypothetical protein
MLEQTRGTNFSGVDSKKIVLIWRLCYVVSKGENTHMGKFKKIWFGPFRV